MAKQKKTERISTKELQKLLRFLANYGIKVEVRQIIEDEFQVLTPHGMIIAHGTYREVCDQLTAGIHCISAYILRR